MLIRWDQLPESMQTREVRRYYNILARKSGQLKCKRILDVCVSCILLAAFCLPMLIIAAAIKIDSEGEVIFKQRRVTRYKRVFYIYKFRTMRAANGAGVTVAGDKRVTRVGAFLRKYKLDELPQLINVLKGEMTLVGTRPEIEEFVKYYKPCMEATFLLPAGITSSASVKFRDEEAVLKKYMSTKGITDVNRAYVQKILPEKMRYNLKDLREFSMFNDIKILLKTVF